MPNIETTKELFEFLGDNIQSRNVHDETCERSKTSEDKAARLGCRCVDRFKIGLPDRYARAVKADALLEQIAALEGEASQTDQMKFEIGHEELIDEKKNDPESKD